MLRLSPPHISSYCAARSCIECGFHTKQLPLCAHASHRSEPLRSSRTISLRWRLQLTEQMPRKPGTAPEHCNSNSRLRTERCRQGRSRNEVKPRACLSAKGGVGRVFTSSFLPGLTILYSIWNSDTLSRDTVSCLIRSTVQYPDVRTRLRYRKA